MTATNNLFKQKQSGVIKNDTRFIITHVFQNIHCNLLPI